MTESRQIIGSAGAEPDNDQHPHGGASTPPRKMKRTLTVGNFFKTVGNVVVSAPVLLSALIRPKTSAALREKVMENPAGTGSPPRPGSSEGAGRGCATAPSKPNCQRRV